MNWLDIVIVLVIVFFASSAFRAGLILEVVTLASVAVGIIVAGLFYDDLARDVLTFIDNEKTALIVSFLVLLGEIGRASCRERV